MSALAGWRAMRLVRKHALPHLRPENLAEHTWGVLHNILFMYPDAPASLLRAALYHDLGEHKPGDIPGDFKAAHPEVRDACEAYELEAAKEALPEYLHECLEPAPEELFLVKIADRVEFAFSCYHEWMLGNRYSLGPMDRTIDIAWDYIRESSEITSSLPAHVSENLNNLMLEATRLRKEMKDHGCQ